MSQKRFPNCYKDARRRAKERFIAQEVRTIDLDILVSDYGEKLLRYATSILYNHHDAQDVVQDVFITLHQKPGAFKGGNLSAYLYKITYNKSINKLRRRKWALFSEIPENTVAPLAEEGFSDETLQALSLLSPKERALLYGRIMEGMSYEDLSLQMGKSATALRKQYERAKKKLARHLSYDLEGGEICKT